jgi:hypothetical protein
VESLVRLQRWADRTALADNSSRARETVEGPRTAR